MGGNEVEPIGAPGEAGVVQAISLEDIDPTDERLRRDVLPVLVQLRQDLTASRLREIYAEGHHQGLRFLAAYRADACVGVAGWRLVATTGSGRKLYVDDLVTSADARSEGVGRALLEELDRRARAAGCSAVDLDSGVHRGRAHRFYFREGMVVSSFHFRKPLA